MAYITRLDRIFQLYKHHWYQCCICITHQKICAKVSPTEIEAVLVSHPKVADAGVIAIPDPVDGELPKAYIVKKDQSLTETEIRLFVQGRLLLFSSETPVFKIFHGCCCRCSTLPLYL